ncbi:hypothetical protein QUC31_014108 [Theobroma cacao]
MYCQHVMLELDGGKVHTLLFRSVSLPLRVRDAWIDLALSNFSSCLASLTSHPNVEFGLASPKPKLLYLYTPLVTLSVTFSEKESGTLAWGRGKSDGGLLLRSGEGAWSGQSQ